MLFGGDRDVPEGIGMARLPWTRLPTADAEGLGASTSAVADDDLFSSAVVKSLDYEVIENYTYREEQDGGEQSQHESKV
ncbi:chloride channel protein CLC-d-like isoform X3 [Phragmites australis]|uniref:chloride channel protein CLC-d-like isoform X3 n=1 Tax=Phragmites australis TaxID=29695 RepID=UPI002D79E9E5|nr:chloride channel protein CLC-d-like isoform X3 [Phragmites australis]